MEEVAADVADATGPGMAEPVATSADEATEDDDDDDEETDDAAGKVCAFNCHFSVGTDW